MDFLLDPNVAYILLVAGFMLVLLSIVIPGTGAPEAATVICLALAAYSVYNLSVNWWALLILLLSVITFYLAIQNVLRYPLLALTIIGAIIGSIFFFPASSGHLISVNPLLASAVSLFTIGYIWFAVEKSIAVSKVPPHHNLEALIGQTGEAKTAINQHGSAQVAGELWSASSNTQINAGEQVKVIARKGFILVVEKIK